MQRFLEQQAFQKPSAILVDKSFTILKMTSDAKCRLNNGVEMAR
jgi:hypothetical protein